MVERVLAFARFDTDPGLRPPAPVRWVLATVTALAGSLVADAVLLRIGTAIFASTKGYDHFQFGDYATLTTIGVIIACVGWPVVTRLCASPRRLFGMLAVAVVLLVPDVYILAKGQPVRAVAVLMVMHLAIAVVTYSALVLGAPTRSGRIRREEARDTRLRKQLATSTSTSTSRGRLR